MKAIIVGSLSTGFILKKIIADALCDKLVLSMPGDKLALIADVLDPADINEQYSQSADGDHFVKYGSLFNGLSFYGPFTNQAIASQFAEAVEDTYVQIDHNPDPDVDRMLQQASEEFNPMQKHVLEKYDFGEYKHLKTPKDIQQCGDTLLQFLLRELSSQEDCDSVDDAEIRLEAAVVQLNDIVDTLPDIQ